MSKFVYSLGDYFRVCVSAQAGWILGSGCIKLAQSCAQYRMAFLSDAAFLEEARHWILYVISRICSTAIII